MPAFEIQPGVHVRLRWPETRAMETEAWPSRLGVAPNSGIGLYRGRRVAEVGFPRMPYSYEADVLAAACARHYGLDLDRAREVITSDRPAQPLSGDEQRRYAARAAKLTGAEIFVITASGLGGSGARELYAELREWGVAVVEVWAIMRHPPELGLPENGTVVWCKPPPWQPMSNLIRGLRSLLRR